MNKQYMRLFDGVRCIGIGLHQSNVKLIGTRSTPTHTALAKTSASCCHYCKPWKVLNPSRATLLHSCAICRKVNLSPNYDYRHGLRFVSTYPSDDSDADEPFINRNFDAFKMRADHGKEGSTSKLQDILKCSQKQTTSILNKLPEILLIPPKTLSDRLQNFRNFGLRRETVIENPWLLIYKPQEIARKLHMVSNMQLDVNVATPLLQLPSYQLKKLSYQASKEAPLIPGRSRILHISNVLECDLSEVCKAAAKHVFLLTIPLERISAILDLLLEYNIPGNDVIKDVWIFRYNPLTIEKRFKEMHNEGIQLKPWVVRCSEEVFTNALRRRVESRNTLGANSSPLEYLAQRLECSLEDMTVLIRRYPPMLKVHVTKTKGVLDFLFSEGFTPQQVYQTPRVLCHSLETMQHRLQQLRDLQHNPLSLLVLCKSKRQFEDYLSRISDRQKKYLQLQNKINC